MNDTVIIYTGIRIKKLINMGSWDLNQVLLNVCHTWFSPWTVDTSGADYTEPRHSALFKWSGQSSLLVVAFASTAIVGSGPQETRIHIFVSHYS
jgi:hypothetical protein